MRLVPGDELRLRYSGDAVHPAWQSVGHVVRDATFLFALFFPSPFSFQTLHMYIGTVFFSSCSYQ